MDFESVSICVHLWLRISNPLGWPLDPNIQPSVVRANPHNGSNLQTMPLFKAHFGRKNRAILQKIGGFWEIIFHFFLHFPCFLGFCQSQAIAFQSQAAIQPLPKKSCQKHSRRFFVRFGMCHNRRMNRTIVQWEMGREDKDES
jgi:hypothetical protein